MPTSATRAATMGGRSPLRISRDTLLRRLTVGSMPRTRATTIAFGPPGTGKSSLFGEVARTLNVPDYWFAAHPDATAPDLIGGWTPAPDGSGKWQFTPGPMLRAWGVGGHPGILVIDDIHEAGPGIMAGLYTALNKETARYTMPDGSTVRPAPEYWCFATSNETPASLRAPIKDRSAQFFQVLELSTPMLDSLRPEIRILAANDYDGVTDDPNATFREWQSISRNWTAFEQDKIDHPDIVEHPLAEAVIIALDGDMMRGERMLEVMSRVGIKEAATAYTALISLKP